MVPVGPLIKNFRSWSLNKTTALMSKKVEIAGSEGLGVPRPKDAFVIIPDTSDVQLPPPTPNSAKKSQQFGGPIFRQNSFPVT